MRAQCKNLIKVGFFLSFALTSSAFAALNLQLCGGNNGALPHAAAIYNNGKEQICFEATSGDQNAPVTDFTGYRLYYTLQYPHKTGYVPITQNQASSGSIFASLTQNRYHQIVAVAQGDSLDAIRSGEVNNGQFYVSLKANHYHALLDSVMLCQPGKEYNADSPNCVQFPLGLTVKEPVVYPVSSLAINANQTTFPAGDMVKTFTVAGLGDNLNLQDVSVYLPNGKPLIVNQGLGNVWYVPYQTVYLQNGIDSVPWYTSYVGVYYTQSETNGPKTYYIAIKAKGATFNCAQDDLCGLSQVSNNILSGWPVNGDMMGPAPIGANGGGSYGALYKHLGKNLVFATPNKVLTLQIKGRDHDGNRVNVFKNFQVCKVSYDRETQQTTANHLTAHEGSALLLSATTQNGVQC